MDAFASKVAAASLRLIPRNRVSRWMGRLADSTPPQQVLSFAIDAFVRAYRVDLDEADVPAQGWSSFDEFFTRKLRAGVRPIASGADVIVSPADGRLDEVGIVEPGGTFTIKGKRYDAAELLGLEEEARAFLGGHFAIIYLAPPDYHRVHAPVTGEVDVVRHVAGTLFPVNSIGTLHVPNLFAKNERIAVVQKTPTGHVATVMVGAIGVGRISLAFDPIRSNTGLASATRKPAGVALDRGQELGTFHLGSTVVLFASKEVGCTWERGAGVRVKMGERLGRMATR